MSDRATPNLPAIDFETTSRFYATLRFRESWRDDAWMLLARGELTLEFFPHPGLVAAESWFSCCLRLDDLDGFYADCMAAGVPEKSAGFPRMSAPRREPSGLRIGYLLDPNGTLLRLIQNGPA